MTTPYIRLFGIIEKDSLVGSILLPVTLRQAVWIEYKHRWLFWRQVKAVHQTVSSDYPYVEIKFSEYITINYLSFMFFLTVVIFFFAAR